MYGWNGRGSWVPTLLEVIYFWVFSLIPSPFRENSNALGIVPIFTDLLIQKFNKLADKDVTLTLLSSEVLLRNAQVTPNKQSTSFWKKK